MITKKPLTLDEMMKIAEKVERWDCINEPRKIYEGKIGTVGLEIGVYSSGGGMYRVNSRECYVESSSMLVDPPLIIGIEHNESINSFYDSVCEQPDRVQYKRECECFERARELIE